MDIIDLRSDTMTLPSEEMRRAMAQAELGDDVFGEDPTVNHLEERVADLLGKPAALFVSSGTMGNLVGVLLHADRAEEVIVDADAHVFRSESAGLAAVGGVQLRPVRTERGIMSASQVEGAIRPLDDDHQPFTAAVTIENTHNAHGGVAWSLDELRAVRAVTERHQIAVHIDGARLFNAALAANASPRAIAACGDSITFCFSKGLGCPAGSVIASTPELIRSGRRWRKLLGGGMRQTGVLAAAGLYSLDHMIDRLVDDHANARLIATEIGAMQGISLDLSRVQSNIIVFDLEGMEAEVFLSACASKGVLGLPRSKQSVRFVTHWGVNEADAKTAVDAVAFALANR